MLYMILPRCMHYAVHSGGLLRGCAFASQSVGHGLALVGHGLALVLAVCYDTYFKTVRDITIISICI